MSHSTIHRNRRKVGVLLLIKPYGIVIIPLLNLTGLSYVVGFEGSHLLSAWPNMLA